MVGQLKQAIKNRDKKTIARVMNNARGKGIKLENSLIKQAKYLLREMNEESKNVQEISKLRKSTKDLLLSDDESKIKAWLERAKNFEKKLQKEIKQLSDRLKKLVQISSATDGLNKAIATRNIEALRSAITTARRLNVPTLQAERDLDNFLAQHDLLSKMKRAIDNSAKDDMMALLQRSASVTGRKLNNFDQVIAECNKALNSILDKEENNRKIMAKREKLRKERELYQQEKNAKEQARKRKIKEQREKREREQREKRERQKKIEDEMEFDAGFDMTSSKPPSRNNSNTQPLKEYNVNARAYTPIGSASLKNHTTISTKRNSKPQQAWVQKQERPYKVAENGRNHVGSPQENGGSIPGGYVGSSYMPKENQFNKRPNKPKVVKYMPKKDISKSAQTNDYTKQQENNKTQTHNQHRHTPPFQPSFSQPVGVFTPMGVQQMPFGVVAMPPVYSMPQPGVLPAIPGANFVSMQMYPYAPNGIPPQQPIHTQPPAQAETPNGADLFLSRFN
eukprot:CAMPEP_0168539532 /NCGR_PEP_ID=MMETSP0405-20121227/21886_1 /TAXON_ID=498012 /ORGANISM="Trichosphaerium sp, Strain Am-I-7 wt" /LENGTH=506 /DNA_ID=CAMNT_0008569117 /DNA_START=54 /DNA_END=1574 /DNA_ORIENTATION=-